MSWSFREADRAGEIESRVRAIDPTTLTNPRDRVFRAAVLTIVAAFPPTAGITVMAESDDDKGFILNVKRTPFGSYAT